MKQIGKLNILGTDYTVKVDSEKTNSRLKGLAGYCDFSVKEIYLDESIFKQGPSDMERLEVIVNDVLRHEIVHAYMRESGIADSFQTEVIVEWVAKMLPKIEATCQKIIFTDGDIVYEGDR